MNEDQFQRLIEALSKLDGSINGVRLQLEEVTDELSRVTGSIEGLPLSDLEEGASAIAGRLEGIEQTLDAFYKIAPGV
jgi:hypothetical protein